MSTVNDAKNIQTSKPALHKEDNNQNHFDGHVVSITAAKLVMKNKEGKEYSHTLAKDAKLTCDGAVCKAEDMKAGNKIRVTTKKDEQSVATGIESLNKHHDFAKCT